VADKPKPYTVLTIVQSEKGSWSYEIRVSHRTGLTYCTCSGYAFKKRCKHLDAYIANPVVVAAPRPVAVPPPRQTAILRTELARYGAHLTEDQCARVLAKLTPAAATEAAIVVPSVRVIILAD